MPKESVLQRLKRFFLPSPELLAQPQAKPEETEEEKKAREEAERNRKELNKLLGN